MSRTCPVCGHLHADVLLEYSLSLPPPIDIPGRFDVVECLACGMVYNDSPVTTEQLDNYYRSSFYQTTRPYRLDGSRLERVANYLAPRFGTASRVLEVGSGNGQLLAILKAKGLEDCHGWNQGDEWPNRKFDLIIVNHVLEHVLDVREFIGRVSNLLAPTGTIYIEVPDADRYAFFPQESFSYFNFEHVNHFTARHLKMLMGEPVDSGRGVFEVVAGYPYPIIYGLWNRPSAMRLYVGRGREDEQAFVRRILTTLNGRTRVAVRGYSHRAWHILSLPELSHLEIVAKIDRFSSLGSNTMPPDVPVLVLADSRSTIDSITSEYGQDVEVIS